MVLHTLHDVIEDLPNEVWSQLSDSSKMVSNYGRVKTHRSNRIRSDTNDYNWHLMKPHRVRGGYYNIMFKDRSEHLIHRLVAEAFIHNPEGKPYIHHKDHDKSNNSVDNLEWVTMAENNDDPAVYDRSYIWGREKAKRLGETITVKIDGLIYDGIRYASKSTGISRYAINNCLKNNKPVEGHTIEYVRGGVAYDFNN
jgi:hypothetical protein